MTIPITQHLECCVQLQSPNTKKDGQTLQEPKEGHNGQQRPGKSVLQGKDEGHRYFLPAEEKAYGHLIKVFKHLKGG